MTDAPQVRTRQLALPSLPSVPSLPDELVRQLLAQSPDDACDAMVHLRCPGCAWSQTLRIPRRSHSTDRLERLLPRVPVRHWVFSLGEAAQPRLIGSPRLRTRVARACVGAVFGWLRRAGARASIAEPTSCGAVSAIHRVGSALEVNVHVHALVLDGVYTRDPGGTAMFHPLPPPRRRDLRRTLCELRGTLDALLARAPARPLASRTKARVVHRVATGPQVRPVAGPVSTGAVVQRIGQLDVHAGPPVPAGDHVARARLCRYVTRAPFDPTALGPGSEGRLRYRLRHPFSDGTTHVELSPRALAERLQALAAGELRPPVAYHGMLAPGAVWSQPAGSRQLPLLPSSPRVPGRSGRARSSDDRDRTLRCPRCDTSMDIVGVEPARPRAA